MSETAATDSLPNIRASVVIPTRNRKECLRNAIRSALNQTVSVEVIVLDDASTDGTSEMMHSEFPDIRYARFDTPSGPCHLRNLGSEMARAPILFPIDDDAVFVSPNTVEQTLAEFDDPRVGAVGIPFINVRKSEEILQLAPDADRIYITKAYIGASHALRRELFLELRGYREVLFYMGEEGDYCIRMLDAGYFVRLGRADPIHHLESPQRVSKKAALYGRRNDILFAWYNVPLPELIGHVCFNLINQILFSFRNGFLIWMMQGIGMAMWTIARCPISSRRPVSRKTYWMSRELQKLTPHQLINFSARVSPDALLKNRHEI